MYEHNYDSFNDGTDQDFDFVELDFDFDDTDNFKCFEEC